jgi:hypothetical protein
MSESTAIECVDESSVQVRTTGADVQQCTVMLVITADSHKLPPFANLRKQNYPKKNFYQELL